MISGGEAYFRDRERALQHQLAVLKAGSKWMLLCGSFERRVEDEKS